MGKIVLEKNVMLKIETLNLYDAEKAPYFILIKPQQKINSLITKIIIQ